MACVIVAMLFHPVWSYIFVSKNQLNFGIVGTGIAGVITNFSILAFNVIYSYCLPDIKEAIFLPDKRSYDLRGI